MYTQDLQSRIDVKVKSRECVYKGARQATGTFIVILENEVDVSDIRTPPITTPRFIKKKEKYSAIKSGRSPPVFVFFKTINRRSSYV